MAQGCQSYNDCFKEEAKATNCIDHGLFSLMAHTAKIVMRYIEERFRTYMEISLDLEEVKELGM
jgi:hypothetical protein